jgi:solute carrier family 25 carnitine/acylcarnitine transporter 20/29
MLKQTYMWAGLAGAFSSFFTTPILGPGERLKCVLQIQSNAGYTGPKYNGLVPVPCLRHIARQAVQPHGYSPIYTGSKLLL